MSGKIGEFIIRNKNKIIWFIIIGLIIIVSYYFNRSIKEEKSEIKPEEISKEDLIIKDFIDKYQVTTSSEELIYTLQAQEKFITGKPTLFTNAYIDDIFNRDGRIFVRFSSGWFSNNYYILELECNKEIVDKILSQKGGDNWYDLDGDYAVVANILEVIKPVFALKGSTISEGEVEINIEPSEEFIVKGVCIDVSFIDNK
jgi:hypothetical protein